MHFSNYAFTSNVFSSSLRNIEVGYERQIQRTSRSKEFFVSKPVCRCLGSEFYDNKNKRLLISFLIGTPSPGSYRSSMSANPYCYHPYMMAYMNHARTRLHSHGQCVACHYYVPFYVLNIIFKKC